MATQIGRDASIYWGTGTPQLIGETRNITSDLGSEFADDTVHGDQVRTFVPTYASANISVTGLYDTTAGKSNEIVANALAKASGKFSVYIGGTGRYLYGSGYVSVDEVGVPYDDFATFNWSIRPSAAIGQYQAA